MSFKSSAPSSLSLCSEDAPASGMESCRAEETRAEETEVREGAGEGTGAAGFAAFWALCLSSSRRGAMAVEAEGRSTSAAEEGGDAVDEAGF